MKLLIKNGLKGIFVDKMQFIFYIILLSMSMLFTMTFGITVVDLMSANNFMYNPNVNYTYSYKFTSSGYSSNDTSTLSPFFSFDNELVSYQINEENQELTYLPTLTIGEDGAILPFNFDFDLNTYKRNGDILLVNFHLGDNWSDCMLKSENDIQMCNSNKINEEHVNIAKGEFGDFIKLNFKSNAFNNSLIGELYTKYDLKNYQENKATDAQKNIAEKIYEYFFILNNSSMFSGIKNYILNHLDIKIGAKNNDVINKLINGINSKQQIIRTIDDIENNGFQGRIGNIVKDNNKKLAYYFMDKNYITNKINGTVFGDPNDSISKYGSYFIKDFESKNIFLTNYSSINPYELPGKEFTQGKLAQVYYELVGDLSGYDINLRNQVVMWDASGRKMKLISMFFETTDINGNNIIKYKDEENFKIFHKSDSEEDQFKRNTFAISKNFANANDLQLGGIYKIIPGSDIEMTLGALTGDSLNVFTTIYDEDAIPDAETQAIIYMNAQDFQDLFSDDEYKTSTINSIPISKFQDLSRAYLTPNNKNANITTFKKYLGDNIASLGKTKQDIDNRITKEEDLTTSTAIKVQDYKDTALINLRVNSLNKITMIYMIIAIIFVFIFMCAILFVVHTIISKMISKQKQQLGNLKSLGYRKSKILIPFVFCVGLPVLILSPISWGVAYILQKPIMSVFENYFNIPDSIQLGWPVFLATTLGFTLLVFIMSYLVSWNIVRKDTLSLLSPNKQLKPNMLFTKIFSKFKTRSFYGNLRIRISAISLKDLSIFFATFFVFNFILTASILVPTTIDKIKGEYFKNVSFENEINYSYSSSSIPTSRFSFYGINENNFATAESAPKIDTVSPISGKIKIKNNVYKNILDPSIDWQKLAGDGNSSIEEFNKYVENMILYNFGTFKSNNISLALLDEISNKSKELDNQNKNIVIKNLNYLSCNILPAMFGQKPEQENKDYRYCITDITQNVVTPEIKTLWDDNENYKNYFSFGFSSIPVTNDTENLYTGFNSYLTNVPKSDENNPIEINTFGLANDKKIGFKDIDFKKISSTKENVVPIFVNETFKTKYKKGVGDIITFKTKDEGLYLNDNFLIQQDDWFYSEEENKNLDINDNKNQKLSDMDFSKFTYSNQDFETNTWTYHDDKTNSELPYKKVKNIILAIDKNNIYESQIDSWKKFIIKQGKENENQKYNRDDIDENFDVERVMFEKGDKIYIRPFDINMYIKGEANPQLNNTDVFSGRITPYDAAIEMKLFTKKDFELLKNNITYKIVGISKTYESPEIFMSQLNANKILGNPDPEKTIKLNNDREINIWSNAKFSSNKISTDQFFRMILQTKYGSIGMRGFQDNGVSAIGRGRYVTVEKQIVNKLSISAFSIVIIFIIVIIMSAIIVLFLVTDLFINRFKSFIITMRVQGYTMKEIHRVLILMFGPLALIGSLIGAAIAYLVFINSLIEFVIRSSFSLPIVINGWMFGVVILLSLIVFAIAYIISVETLRKTNIAEFVGGSR